MNERLEKFYDLHPEYRKAIDAVIARSRSVDEERREKVENRLRELQKWKTYIAQTGSQKM